MKTRVSALMDGELDTHEAVDVLHALSCNGDQQSNWRLYHVTRDALRRQPDLAIDITANVMSALALEPTVLAPARKRRGAVSWQRPMMAIAAAAAGVAVVAWVALAPVNESNSTAMAGIKPPSSAPVSGLSLASAAPSPAADQSARLQEYLVAHQTYAPGGALAGGVSRIRTVAVAIERR